MKPTDHRVLFNAGSNFLFAADYRPVEDRPGRLLASLRPASEAKRLTTPCPITHLCGSNPKVR
jgi:hypothetical protein